MLGLRKRQCLANTRHSFRGGEGQFTTRGDFVSWTREIFLDGPKTFWRREIRRGQWTERGDSISWPETNSRSSAITAVAIFFVGETPHLQQTGEGRIYFVTLAPSALVILYVVLWMISRLMFRLSLSKTCHLQEPWYSCRCQIAGDSVSVSVSISICKNAGAEKKHLLETKPAMALSRNESEACFSAHFAEQYGNDESMCMLQHIVSW